MAIETVTIKAVNLSAVIHHAHKAFPDTPRAHVGEYLMLSLSELFFEGVVPRVDEEWAPDAYMTGTFPRNGALLRVSSAVQQLERDMRDQPPVYSSLPCVKEVISVLKSLGQGYYIILDLEIPD